MAAKAHHSYELHLPDRLCASLLVSRLRVFVYCTVFRCLYMLHVKSVMICVSDYPPVVVPPAPDNAMSYDGGGPRLMITKIVNENFKSYAGTETLGPFHKASLSLVLVSRRDC